MCGACGILQNGHDWTEGFGVGARADELAPHLRLAERRRRLSLVNVLLVPTGVQLREQGRQMVLRGTTGRAAVVTDLAHVWREADRIGWTEADPLDLPGMKGRP